MAKNKAQLDTQVRIQRIHARYRVVSRAVPWIGIVAISYIWADAIKFLAGQETIADISVKIVENLTVKITQTQYVVEYVEYAVIVLAVLYGLRQRKLRRDVIEKMEGRVRELEQRVDPNRSSSNLTSRGDTNPTDRG